MTYRNAWRVLLGLLLLLAGCGSSADAPAANALEASDLLGSPSMNAGSELEITLQGLTSSDELTVVEAPDGIVATLTGDEPGLRLAVDVDADVEPGTYPVDFELRRNGETTNLRWDLVVANS